ncbi:MAG: hypothetical protein HY266_10175 [Deltaproteobacteria bacterium]|nr:hypothetical protein [Deltaproteobacteria bacterium]
MGKKRYEKITVYRSCKARARTLLFRVSYILFFSLGIASAAMAASGNSFGTISQPVILKNIAILPFENLSDNPAATKILGEFIKRELRGKGWVFITKDDAVEEFLAKRRIRYTGGVTRLVAREMGKVLGVDAVLVGSINQFYAANKGKIDVGVTARLVSTIDGSIIWADSLSYTESDFVGLLGLGLITSVDNLSSRVAKDLVRGIADQFFIKKEVGLSPFEVEKAEAYPSAAKGGTRIELRVKMLPITEEPKEVKAIIAGNKIGLVRGEDGEYEGSVTAPADEGVYPVDVVAMDQTMSPFPFGAVAEIVIDSTPPKVSLTVSKKAFAPQRKGYILFTPKLLSFDEIDEWSIEIFNKEGKGIRGDKGYGKLPKGLIWRGETDKLVQASDGEYTYKFVVKDAAGNETVLTDSIRVKNNPPVLKVDVDKIEDNLLFTFGYDQDENIRSWELDIMDKGGKPVKTIEGRGELPPKLEYPIKADFDISAMAFSITATDDADNSVTVTKSIQPILSKKTPFAKANAKGQVDEDF